MDAISVARTPDLRASRPRKRRRRRRRLRTGADETPSRFPPDRGGPAPPGAPSTEAHFHLGGAPPDEDLLHPYLAPAAALYWQWAGREAIHAGVFEVGGGAILMLGDKEAGKSTTLAWLATQGGTPVLSDDLAVLDGDDVLVGPRSIDLRVGQGTLPGVSEHLVRSGERHRVRLPAASPTLPLAGLVVLDWAPEAELGPGRLRRPHGADRTPADVPDRAGEPDGVVGAGQRADDPGRRGRAIPPGCAVLPPLGRLLLLKRRPRARRGSLAASPWPCDTSHASCSIVQLWKTGTRPATRPEPLGVDERPGRARARPTIRRTRGPASSHTASPKAALLAPLDRLDRQEVAHQVAHRLGPVAEARRTALVRQRGQELGVEQRVAHLHVVARTDHLEVALGQIQGTRPGVPRRPADPTPGLAGGPVEHGVGVLGAGVEREPTRDEDAPPAIGGPAERAPGRERTPPGPRRVGRGRDPAVQHRLRVRPTASRRRGRPRRGRSARCRRRRRGRPGRGGTRWPATSTRTRSGTDGRRHRGDRARRGGPRAASRRDRGALMTCSCQSDSSVSGLPGNRNVKGIGRGSPSRRATCVATARTADESRPPEKLTTHGVRSRKRR